MKWNVIQNTAIVSTYGSLATGKRRQMHGAIVKRSQKKHRKTETFLNDLRKKKKQSKSPKVILRKGKNQVPLES